MTDVTLIQPADVVRDKDGEWTHPDFPDFGEDQKRCLAWYAEQGLEFKYKMLESEDLDHPAYVRIFEEDGTDFSDWNPTPPEGDGWFTLFISHIEDGPIWAWARRLDWRKPA